jgi:hypothetical protein
MDHANVVAVPAHAKELERPRIALADWQQRVLAICRAARPRCRAALDRRPLSRLRRGEVARRKSSKRVAR